MPNSKNNAASSHADAAATVTPESGIFYFTFPHSKEPTKIHHALAASLTDRQKKKWAYEWLAKSVLPVYSKRNESEGKYFDKYFAEALNRQNLEKEKEAVLKRIDEQNKKILFFTTYGTFPN